ncbi:uncharacterized protein LOC143058313 [Mytilus galloprovincialis]|uniref:uncharacterized protein LOC143058313 n=1 Tax=Mytilus galloprovincialis TaxID=29158 RepID=UPI003F7C5B04
MKDIRSIDRGKCLNCHECEEFTGTLRCDYCDCVAAKHIRKQEEEAITGDESNKHFKLDTLEHSGHSDVGLTSLTSGFENLEENCVEEVSNVNDSIFHDGISRLESLISELEKEENEKFNVSCKFKVVEEDGKSMFSCSLCNKNYKLGDFGKKIQNVKFHASSRGHLANVYAAGQILSDSDEYCDDDDLDPCIATDETQEIHDSSDDSQDENSTYTPMNIFEPTSSEFMEMHECIDVAIDNFEEHSDQNSVNIDDSIPSSLQKRQRIDATLLVPEHGIQHKSTLVKLLNEDPNLSKDRLVRVRQAALPNMAKSAQLGTDNGINLFEDFAYVDRTAKTFQIGRIQRMQRTIVAKNKRQLDIKIRFLFRQTF